MLMSAKSQTLRTILAGFLYIHLLQSEGVPCSRWSFFQAQSIRINATEVSCAQQTIRTKVQRHFWSSGS